MYVLLLQQSVWLDDAFDRAKQLYLSYYRSIPKSLERSTAHKLMLAMLDGDERFVEPTPNSLQQLTLEQVKDAVMNQFVSDNMEVCIFAFFSIVCLKYALGLFIIYQFDIKCLLISVISFFVCLTGEYCWRLLGRGY